MAPTPPSQSSGRPAPGSPPIDTAVARATAPAVRWVSSLPPVVPVLAVAVLVVAGGVIEGWGWVLLAIAALALAWVLAISWPRLTTPERLLRIAVLALVVAVTLARAFPR